MLLNKLIEHSIFLHKYYPHIDEHQISFLPEGFTISTDTAFGSAICELNYKGVRIADLLIGSYIDENTPTPVSYNASLVKGWEIEFTHPGKYQQSCINFHDDDNDVHDEFLIDYSTEESIFQSSLVHQFDSTADGAKEVLWIQDNLTIDLKDEKSVLMSVRCNHIKLFAKLMGMPDADN